MDEIAVEASMTHEKAPLEKGMERLRSHNKDMSQFPLAPTGTEARVCYDIAARQLKGVSKYGVTIEQNPLSLLEWLQHAYEETLDQAIYLKRAIDEMENPSITHGNDL